MKTDSKRNQKLMIWITAVLHKLGFGIALLASVLTIASLLGRLHWTLDVFSLFHLQYVGLLLLALLGLLVVEQRGLYAVAVLPALLVNLVLVGSFFVGGETAVSPSSTPTEPLRVMTLNISTSNAGYLQVVELLREREPDLVFMSEVRQDLVDLLATELGDLYPVQVAEPSRFTLGLAILARDPAVRVQTVQADENIGRMSRRYLRADFAWQGEAATLVGIHPLPPIRENWAEGRDRELLVMRDLAMESERPFILLGDLNASPWSQAMRRLTQEADLSYANKGYGIWPTWLIGNQVVGRLIGAPLDHVLHSSAWRVVDYSQAGDIGSDHLPVQADLILAGSELKAKTAVPHRKRPS